MMNSRLFVVLRALAYVVVALVLVGVVFQLMGFSSLLMFRSIAEGAFLSKSALLGSLRWAVPLFLSALGVLIAFRAGFFNVGAQGQFYLGAIFAATAVHFLDGAPAFVVVPATLIAGALGGALWALWPGLLRVRSGTDEVLTTLMANFIAGLLLIYVTSGPLKDPTGTGELSASKPVDAAYRISTSAGLSPLILGIAAVAAVLVWLLMNRTAFGVLSGLAGRNPVMTTWQGARLERLGLAAFVLSGLFAGLAGAIEFMGPSGRLVSGFMPAHGFTAILIALVGGLSVVGVVASALFFGGLASASLYLPIIAGLPSAAIDVINAAIALFITARAGPGTALLARFKRQPDKEAAS